MKCFYHDGAEAVGCCKHCARGLCRVCAGERAGGLACPNRCEAAVDGAAILVARNVRIATKPAIHTFLIPAIFILFGIANFYWAFRTNDVGGDIKYYYVIGGFCGLFGIVRLLTIWRYWSKLPNTNVKNPN